MKMEYPDAPDYDLQLEAFPLKYNSAITADALNFPVFWETRNVIVNRISGQGGGKDITQPTVIVVKCGKFFNETAVMAIADDYSLESQNTPPMKVAHIKVFELGKKFANALPPEYSLDLQAQALAQIENIFAENKFKTIVVENVNRHATICKLLGYELLKTEHGRLIWSKRLRKIR